jgi:hypothetical protein
LGLLECSDSIYSPLALGHTTVFASLSSCPEKDIIDLEEEKANVVRSNVGSGKSGTPKKTRNFATGAVNENRGGHELHEFKRTI